MQLGTLEWTLTLLLWITSVHSARFGESVARTWLKGHPDPQADDLVELKTANPEAYAIVKALLTKRSLGILNPKHPTVSFSTPAKATGSVAATSGPAAFQALASTGSALASAAAYPESPALATHHDWMHWKPKESAVDEEAMVNSVLGAVADLKSSHPRTQSLLGNDRGNTPQEVAEVAQPPAAKLSVAHSVQPVQASQQAPAGQDNPYLKGLNLGDSMPVTLPRTADDENPYLASADLAPHTPKPKTNLRQDSTDYLASFSWDDEQQKPQKAVAGAASPVSVPPHSSVSSGIPSATAPPQAPRHSNALLAWLSSTDAQGGADKPAAPSQPEVPESAAKHWNPYMSYLH